MHGVKVSALYRDASIGNAINIVMVRLMLLENESLEVSGARASIASGGSSNPLHC